MMVLIRISWPNVCMHAVTTLPTPCTKKLLLMLFLVVLVLMLGTICACIAFALEISDLKSKTPLTDTENSFATDTQQQDLSDMVKEINNSLLQFQMDTSFDYQGLKGLTTAEHNT